MEMQIGEVMLGKRSLQLNQATKQEANNSADQKLHSAIVFGSPSISRRQDCSSKCCHLDIQGLRASDLAALPPLAWYPCVGRSYPRFESLLEASVTTKKQTQHTIAWILALLRDALFHKTHRQGTLSSPPVT